MRKMPKYLVIIPQSLYMPESPIDEYTPRNIAMNEKMREYAELAAIAIDEGKTDILPYLTPNCQECDENAQTPINAPYHCNYAGFTLIGCEGYFIVNPNKLGIITPNWDDSV